VADEAVDAEDQDFFHGFSVVILRRSRRICFSRTYPKADPSRSSS
jgi:hypothetical protein